MLAQQFRNPCSLKCYFYEYSAFVMLNCQTTAVKEGRRVGNTEQSTKLPEVGFGDITKDRCVKESYCSALYNKKGSSFGESLEQFVKKHSPSFTA